MGAFSDAFASALRKEVTKAESIGTKIAHRAVYNLVTDVVNNSPIRQPHRWFKKYPDAQPGHYKANWQIGIDTRPENSISEYDTDGEATKSREFAKLFSNDAISKKPKTIYLVNNAKSIKGKKGRDRLDIENDGAAYSEMESYALAIEDGVGVGRDTWAYQLDDRGIEAPGAVLGRAKINWSHHIQDAIYGE